MAQTFHWAIIVTWILLTLPFELSMSTSDAENDCLHDAFIYYVSRTNLVGGTRIKGGQRVFNTDLENSTHCSDKEHASKVLCPCPTRTCYAIPLFGDIPAGVIKHVTTDVVTTKVQFPLIYDSKTLKLSHLDLITELDGTNQFFYVFQYSPCDDGTIVLRDMFELLDNGSIYLHDSGEVLADDDYFFVLENGTFIAATCHSNQFAYESEGLRVLLPYGQGLSVLCFIVTLVIYTILPELNNIHGMTLRGYALSALTMWTTILILNVLPIGPDDTLSRSVCITFGFVIYFSLLSSFLWLNVMCIDIWWTFRSLRPQQASVKRRDRRRFLHYAIYAWGCASMMTILLLIMTFAPSVPTNLKPSFIRGSGCWFSDPSMATVYYFTPVGLTIICNICLFISTIWRLLQHQRNMASQFNGYDNQRYKDHKKRFSVYLKFFVAMGINWSTEVLGWFFMDDVPKVVWDIADLINSLQGVIIFVMFVCKDNKKQMLIKRFRSVEKVFCWKIHHDAPAADQPSTMTTSS